MFVKTLATVLFRHGLSGSKQFVEASVADLVSLYEGNDQPESSTAACTFQTAI